MVVFTLKTEFLEIIDFPGGWYEIFPDVVRVRVQLEARLCVIVDDESWAINGRSAPEKDVSFQKVFRLSFAKKIYTVPPKYFV